MKIAKSKPGKFSKQIEKTNTNRIRQQSRKMPIEWNPIEGQLMRQINLRTSQKIFFFFWIQKGTKQTKER